MNRYYMAWADSAATYHTGGHDPWVVEGDNPVDAAYRWVGDHPCDVQETTIDDPWNRPGITLTVHTSLSRNGMVWGSAEQVRVWPAPADIPVGRTCPCYQCGGHVVGIRNG